MLALAEAVGEQTAPLGELLDAAVARRRRASSAPAGWSTASSRYWDDHRAVLRTRNLAAQEGDQRFRDVRNASLRPLTEGLSRKVAENAVDGHRAVRRGRGAGRDDGAHGRVPRRPRAVRRDPRRRRRDHGPDRVPDRRPAEQPAPAQPLGWAVSSSSRSKTFSKSSRLRRAPQSSSSGSPSVCRRSSTSDGLTRAATPVTTCLRLRSRPSAMRSSAASRRTRSRCVVVELADEVVGRLRLAAPVPAHERGEHEDLLGVEAAELAVRDEVRRVAVVAVVRDVLADVVQQRGVLEELAVVVVEAVELAGLVEELEAELRDVA